MSFNPKKRKFNEEKNKKAQQWGEVKFVPKVPKGSNPFSGPPKFESPQSAAPWKKFKNDYSGRPNQRGNSKFSSRGNNSSNFSRPPRECTDPGTPWKSFKNEIVAKQREEENSNAVDMNSSEAQEMLKQREQNFRRNLIIQKSKETAKWESFDDDDVDDNNDTKKTSQLKGESNHLLKNIDLDNFKSTDLDFKQNNNLRKLLTKGIQMSNDKLSLKAVVKDMKRRKKSKKEFNKLNKERNEN